MENKPKTKKKITVSQFKMYSLIIPLAVSLLGTVVTAGASIVIANINNHQAPDPKLGTADQSQFNDLQTEIESFKNLFYSATDNNMLSRLDGELFQAAKQQSAIMVKNGFAFQSGWPPEYIPVTAGKLQQQYLSKQYGLAVEPPITMIPVKIPTPPSIMPWFIAFIALAGVIYLGFRRLIGKILSNTFEII